MAALLVAEVLGVSESTLSTWRRSGAAAPDRHQAAGRDWLGAVSIGKRGDRYQAQVKAHQEVVAYRTFDTLAAAKT